MAENYPDAPPPPFVEPEAQPLQEKYPLPPSSFANSSQPTFTVQPTAQICPTGPPINTQPQGFPQQTRQAQNGDRDFQYGLFDCFSNPGLCLITWCVPCVPYGEISQETGYGECTSHGIFMALSYLCCQGMCVPCMVCLQRGHVKKTLGIKDEGMLGDFLVGCFCPLCALCQMAKETTKYSMGESDEFSGQKMART